MTEASRQALAILRDGSTLQWYVIPLLAIVVYVYAVEIEKRNWSAVLAGIAFSGMDVINEVCNGVVLHATGRSALWTTPGQSAYLIFVGLNVEIVFMFAMAGITFTKMLPKDPAMRILGVPNRLFHAVCNSLFCVFVEVLLNHAGILVWEYSFWRFPNVLLIVLFGYMPFMLVSFHVYDEPSLSRKLRAVGIVLAVDVVLVLVFGVALGWV